MTALLLGATGMPDPADDPNYVSRFEDVYLKPFYDFAAPTNGCTTDGAHCLTTVPAPEQVFPLSGTMSLDDSVAQGVTNLNTKVDNLLTNPDNHILIVGGSQGAAIATREKIRLAASATPPTASQVEFLLPENINRPNGGILARFPGLHIPLLGITFNGPTPTDTGYQTMDFAFSTTGSPTFPNTQRICSQT